MEGTDALLHALRVRGMVPDPGDAVAAAVVAAGQAVRKHSFLALTPAGRAEADARLRLAHGSPEREATAAAYEGFVPLNTTLIKVCHDWQVRPGGAPNDHRDPAYDWGVIDRLTALDEQAGALVRRLAKRVERFADYRERLHKARHRTADGEQEWLASPRCDSYHTVWMQLHEDLLVALGLERGTSDAERVS